MVLLMLIIIIVFYNFIYDFFTQNFFFIKLKLANNLQLFANIVFIIIINLVIIRHYYIVLYYFEKDLFCIFNLVTIYIIFVINNITNRIIFNKIIIFFIGNYPWFFSFDNFFFKIKKGNIFNIIYNYYYFVKYTMSFSFYIYIFFFQVENIFFIIYSSAFFVLCDSIIYILNINFFFTKLIASCLYNNNCYLFTSGQNKIYVYVINKIIFNRSHIKFIDGMYFYKQYKMILGINNKKDFFIVL